MNAIMLRRMYSYDNNITCKLILFTERNTKIIYIGMFGIPVGKTLKISKTQMRFLCWKYGIYY